MKKSISLISVLLTFALTSCDVSLDGRQASSDKPEKLSLSQIREEANNFDEIKDKYSNMILSETNLYIPEVDEISDFSLIKVEKTAEEFEAELLKVAQIYGINNPSKNNILYLTKDSDPETEKRMLIPFSKVKDNKNRHKDYYFAKYQDGKLDLGINMIRNYLYADKLKTGKIIDFDYKNGYRGFSIEEGYMKKEINLRADYEDEVIELQDGNQSINETLAYMTEILQNDTPYYKSDVLKLVPVKARIFKLGEKSAVQFFYGREYKGVMLDSFRGAYINDDGTTARYSAPLESSCAFKGGVDELYSTYDYDLKAGEKVFTEFISLEKAIENVAEKLTQSHKFRIESVEFCYGLTEIYEDEFYNTPGAKTFEYIPISVYASPVWIINIPKTGIAETPQLRIIVDALTGETEVLN